MSMQVDRRRNRTIAGACGALSCGLSAGFGGGGVGHASHDESRVPAGRSRSDAGARDCAGKKCCKKSGTSACSAGAARSCCSQVDGNARPRSPPELNREDPPPERFPALGHTGSSASQRSAASAAQLASGRGGASGEGVSADTASASPGSDPPPLWSLEPAGATDCSASLVGISQPSSSTGGLLASSAACAAWANTAQSTWPQPVPVRRAQLK